MPASVWLMPDDDGDGIELPWCAGEGAELYASTEFGVQAHGPTDRDDADAYAGLLFAALKDAGLEIQRDTAADD